MGDLAELLTWRTYSGLLYLLLGFAVGLGLSVIVIGIPLLFITVGAVVDFAALERWAARVLVGVD
ncbi:MAG: sensor domain-containing protein, partial [Casimicrobium sp.]